MKTTEDPGSKKRKRMSPNKPTKQKLPPSCAKHKLKGGQGDLRKWLTPKPHTKEGRVLEGEQGHKMDYTDSTIRDTNPGHKSTTNTGNQQPRKHQRPMVRKRSTTKLQEPFNWVQWAALRRSEKERSQVSEIEEENTSVGSKDMFKDMDSEQEPDVGNTRREQIPRDQGAPSQTTSSTEVAEDGY